MKRHGLHADLVDWLAGLDETPDVAGRRAQTIALFNAGRMTEFNRAYRELESANALDDELRLYGAAYLYAWAPPGEIEEGKAALIAALDGPLETTARRLLYFSAIERNEEKLAIESLERLVALNQSTVTDHVIYTRWMILQGQTDKGRDWIGRSLPEPRNAGECVQLSKIYLEYGMGEKARALLEEGLSEYPEAREIWLSLATHLLNKEDWDAVARLAVKLRQNSIFVDGLTGFSHYLEGLADWHSGRSTSARQAFGKMESFGLPIAKTEIATSAQFDVINAMNSTAGTTVKR